MIIRYRTTKTQTASSLSNRGFAEPSDCTDWKVKHSEKSAPASSWATLLGSIHLHQHIQGCSLRSYPWLLSDDRVAVLLVVLFFLRKR